MSQARIVVLSSRTLAFEGVIANLRQSLDEHGLRTIDAQLPGAMDQLVALQPSVLILDATDESMRRHYSLDGLLGALPALIVMRLDPQQGRLQVVTSQQRSIAHISDMVGVIHSLTTTQPAEK